ncbi:LOW QUALITY PROTEIN: rho guanine nucleotide exchange factor 2 [Aphomia sociella]
MLGGAASPGGDDLLTVTVVCDDHGFGMKVSGDNPVYIQSVKENGAAWRAGLRAGDRILRVDTVPVHHHTHQQVVQMIRENRKTVLTVQQNTSRHKRPITAPFPVNPEKQRQLEVSKVETMRRMLEEDQGYIKKLKLELSKVPDVRKQTQLELAEQRCIKLKHEIDVIKAGQPMDLSTSHPNLAPSTPRLTTRIKTNDKGSPIQNSGFLSGLPRSLSNLTGQSLRNLRQARQNSKTQQENQPPLVRQNSDESNNKRRHVHNNTVPMVPTTCLDNVTPPPLPPRSIERPQRNPLCSPVTASLINPMARPKPSSSISPVHKQYYKGPYYPEKPQFPMHQSMPSYNEDTQKQFRRSSHSLDGDLEGPQPNSIALQMSYPLVNVPPPPLQTDNRTGVPVLHVRSRSSPEQLDHEMSRPAAPLPAEKEAWGGGTPPPPPGTPPPPYAHNTQPCADPQRAIISMEEDDSPASDNSTYSGLFSNLRSVRESKARTAVLLNWLLGERRSANAALVLVLTDGFRAAAAVNNATLRRWAYEIHSTFIMPNAVLQLNGVDENMANEIEHVLVNEYDKDEILRNVFRKARQKAKEELTQQLTEFQVKRQVGLGTLYGPEDSVIEKCDVDKTQEAVVVERLLCQRLCVLAQSPPAHDEHAALLAAVAAAALCLQCSATAVAAAVGGSRPSFLQRDKVYKQKVKQLAKQNPNPFVVRGHHLQLQALTSVAHCHHCDNVIWGLAPQAYLCIYCELRVHQACAKSVEEGCCLDGEHHNNRISRFMERIHPNTQPNSQDSSDKKFRKGSGNAHFINMERSFRKMEDEPYWDQTLTPTSTQGESRREGSTEEPPAPDVDVDTSDANTKEAPDKDNNWRTPTPSGRGVNRAESCRERDAPRRGKHRNASDPNRLTAHNNHDLEPCAATAPSGSSSSSSLSSRSNESNTVAAEQQASQSDLSEEDDHLAAQWADSLPPHVLESLKLSPAMRKRQEVIHELIVSEGSHVRWLKVLGGVFFYPLESQPTLLPPEELRALFPNLPSVRERHNRLYGDLRALRSEASSHIVPIRPLADAMLNTLGESGYSSCLARFCRGQRLALEGLRERRRKNKELHQFLSSREQLPLCGRLQLRDLLACVWQRLTKYQLLLEGIQKTVGESDDDNEEDIAQLRRALDTAKDVLHTVDTAIHTAENEHRLRTIQNKLEVRAPAGGEWDELRRLELTQRRLRLEGELSIRSDTNKKIAVLALMLEDSLVLLQREGEKFVLKPIQVRADPSQPGLLSPLIKWDKVLFRPNAAVRNTFFLMNINGVQMHELSVNNLTDYATWVKHIQESPLAKLAEAKPNITPSHQASRSTDDSGINVSRNPSDASEKSTSTVPPDEPSESERDRASLERSSMERDKEEKRVEREDRRSSDKEGEVAEREEKHIPRRPTVGRISTHAGSPRALEHGAAVQVRPPAAATAQRATPAYTHHESLRRLDSVIQRALRAKSGVVGALLGIPPPQYAQFADLAVADALGQVDVASELRLSRQCSRGSDDEVEPDLHQLLLAAHAQAHHLTSQLSRMMYVTEAGTVAARARRGVCDSCRPTVGQPGQSGQPGQTGHTGPRRPLARASTIRSEDNIEPPFEKLDNTEERLDDSDFKISDSMTLIESLDREISFDMLSELDGSIDVLEDEAEDVLEGGAEARVAALACRLAGAAGGLGSTLGRVLAALPALQAERRTLRQQLAAAREANDALRARLKDSQVPDEILLSKSGADQSTQDQPSNGG